jgi:hypothetical protein
MTLTRRAASMGGTYEFVKTASANLREKEDHWNTTWGGFFSGAIIGLRGLFNPFLRICFRQSSDRQTARTFPAVLGYGVAVATVLGVFDYTGGSLRGPGRDPTVDEFERRESMRKNYRSPAEQTFAELGEGRGWCFPYMRFTTMARLVNQVSILGIYAPGYAERRRERIKRNYGIDVSVSQPPAS